MFGYLAYTLVLLIAIKIEIDNEALKVETVQYKDLEYTNNDVDINTYCVDKPCMIKCCGRGQILNYHSECDSFDKLINSSSDVDWNNRLKEIETITKHLSQNLNFIHSEKYATGKLKLSLNGFCIVEDGSITITNEDPTIPEVKVQPLHFCIDHVLDVDNNELVLVYKTPPRDMKHELAVAQSKLIKIGVYVALFFILLIVYALIHYLVIKSKSRPIVKHTKMMFLLNLGAAYIIKAIEIIVLSTGASYPRVCSIISPMLYFSILSTFCWSNITTYVVLKHAWKISRESKITAKAEEEDIKAKLLKYSVYGWGIPLILTLYVMAVNYWNLEDYSTLFMEAPFDSCFTNGRAAWYYLYVPISLCSLANCIMVVLTASAVWRLRHADPPVPGVNLVISTKYRVMVLLKIAAVIAVCFTLSILPFPAILQFVIFINSVVVGVTALYVFILDPLFVDLYKWYQAKKASKKMDSIKEKIFTITLSHEGDKKLLIS